MVKRLNYLSSPLFFLLLSSIHFLLFHHNNIKHIYKININILEHLNNINYKKPVCISWSKKKKDVNVMIAEGERESER